MTTSVTIASNTGTLLTKGLARLGLAAVLALPWRELAPEPDGLAARRLALTTSAPRSASVWPA